MKKRNASCRGPQFFCTPPQIECPSVALFNTVHPCNFWGRRRRPYIVFRNRFLCGFMFVYIYIIIYIYIYIYICVCIYVYICQDGGAVGFVDFTKLSFALSSLT